MTHGLNKLALAFTLPVAAVLLAFLGGAFTAGPTAHAANLRVGLDFSATGTPANGVYNGASLPTFETCAQTTVGGSVTVDVFVLDVTDLAAFEADVQYSSAIVNMATTPPAVGQVNTSYFMASQPGSAVSNLSQATPDTDGLYETAAVDTAVTTVGDTGYGVLARLTFTGEAGGLATVSLPNLDIDFNGSIDTGVFLRNANFQGLNDANGDGWYDGPWTNQSGTIAVGADTDGDGIPSNACPGNPVDNCPNNSNASQANMDGDLEGDACDLDIDGDHYYNNQETDMGSNASNAASKPEICNGTDDDLDSLTDEGSGTPQVSFDLNGNTVPDCVDGAADTDGDGIFNTTDTDDDGDRWSDVVENYVRTESLDKCAGDTPAGTNTKDHAWVPDTDNNKIVTIADALRFGPYFLATLGNPASDSRFNYRYDYSMNGQITISDILSIGPDFLVSCTSPS